MTDKDLITTLFDCMNTRDFSNLESKLEEDAAFDFPGAGLIEGARRIIIFLKALLRKYKTLTFTVHEIVKGEETACAIWTNKGEHTEGYTYSNSGITLFHFSGGKISFISDYFKDTSFVK